MTLFPWRKVTTRTKEKKISKTKTKQELEKVKQNRSDSKITWTILMRLFTYVGICVYRVIDTYDTPQFITCFVLFIFIFKNFYNSLSISLKSQYSIKNSQWWHTVMMLLLHHNKWIVYSKNVINYAQWIQNFQYSNKWSGIYAKVKYFQVFTFRLIADLLV